MRTAVVLPAPFGPSSPSTVPASTRERDAVERDDVAELLPDVFDHDCGGVGIGVHSCAHRTSLPESVEVFKFIAIQRLIGTKQLVHFGHDAEGGARRGDLGSVHPAHEGVPRVVPRGRRRAGDLPGEIRALEALDPAQSQPMRALATELRCDASNVTWLVDRLEARGFVERQASPDDRRVKTLTLTPGPGSPRERIAESMRTPPPPLLALSVAELRPCAT